MFRRKKNSSKEMANHIAAALGGGEVTETMVEMVDLVGGGDVLVQQMIARTGSWMDSQLAVANLITDGMEILKSKQKEDDHDVEYMLEYMEFQGQMKGLALGFAMVTLGVEKIKTFMDMLPEQEALDALSTLGVKQASRMVVAHSVFEHATDGDKGADGAVDLLRKLQESDGDMDKLAAAQGVEELEQMLKDMAEGKDG